MYRLKKMLIAMLATLLLIVLLGIIFANNTSVSADNTSGNKNTEVYGPGVSGDSLSNIIVGGEYKIQVDYRFRAKYSGQISGFIKFLQEDLENTGYSSGNGGTLLFELRSDDMTSQHNPDFTKPVLGSVIYDAPVGKTPFPKLKFDKPADVISGNLYHLIVSNIHPDAVTQYISVNDVLTYGNRTPMQPTIKDEDWSVYFRYEENNVISNWELERMLPCLEFQYIDSSTQGTGWMEVWIGKQKRIDGKNAVREIFTVSKDSFKVTSAYVRLKKVYGTDPLTVRLEKANGDLIRSFTVKNVPKTKTWVGGVFSKACTLQKGQTYHLTFVTKPGTLYMAYPIRDGVTEDTWYGGFSPESGFPDGYAQFTDHGQWIGWEQWDQEDRRDSDLQFYFIANK